MNIRVLLADDHKIVRQGIRGLVETQADMEVVAEAEDGRTTVKLAQEMSPNIVIMDVAMPGLNGIEATHQITRNNHAVKVLALSMYADIRFVTGMLSAGASGYLLKDCAFEELVEAIRSVAKNRVYLSPQIARVVVKDYVNRLDQSRSSVFSVLTDREREVLQLLAEGKTTKEIAGKLSVSFKTIETHRKQIMDKLNINSIAELTKYAVREGISTL